MNFHQCLVLQNRIVTKPSTRTFTATSRTALRPRTQLKELFPRGIDIHRDIPPYPHGPNQWYKQSNSGLYGMARIRSGNNVSKETETKTRRRWKPNVHHHNLFSHALNRPIRLKATTRVLRTIDKVGGLDDYLLGNSHSRIKQLGVTGWILRWAVMKSRGGMKRLRKERAALGLSSGIEEPLRVGPQLDTLEMRERFVQMRYDFGIELPKTYVKNQEEAANGNLEAPLVGEVIEENAKGHGIPEVVVERSDVQSWSQEPQFLEEVKVEKPSISHRFLKAIRFRT